MDDRSFLTKDEVSKKASLMAPIKTASIFGRKDGKKKKNISKAEFDYDTSFQELMAL